MLTARAGVLTRSRRPQVMPGRGPKTPVGGPLAAPAARPIHIARSARGHCTRCRTRSSERSGVASKACCNAAGIGGRRGDASATAGMDTTRTMSNDRKETPSEASGTRRTNLNERTRRGGRTWTGQRQERSGRGKNSATLLPLGTQAVTAPSVSTPGTQAVSAPSVRAPRRTGRQCPECQYPRRTGRQPECP